MTILHGVTAENYRDSKLFTGKTQDGVLTIRVPKKTAAKPRAIPIDVS
jgi:HSP20 family molecular chaperone IbpA